MLCDFFRDFSDEIFMMRYDIYEDSSDALAKSKT